MATRKTDAAQKKTGGSSKKQTEKKHSALKQDSGGKTADSGENVRPPVETEFVSGPGDHEEEEAVEDDFDTLEDIDGMDDDRDPAFSDDPEGGAQLPTLAPDAGALAVFTRRPPERAERARDSLQMYLREINRFPLLQPDEEVELARRVRDHDDPDAAFRLISSHLRLVVRIAMDFQRRWMQNVLDLVQEGNVGLVRAVGKFDPEKGIKFSYYATFWIKAYILKFIMDNWRLVKIGTTQTQRKLFYNLNKERQQLMAQGFTPDPAMLAERLNVPEAQIVEMEQRLDASDMSLDAPVSADDANGATRMDFLPALGSGIEETLGNSEISHMVRERLKSLVPVLTDKEQYILEHRLLSEEPVTLREIGDIFHITRERVRQIEARLLQKVRDHLFKNIKDFSRDWIER